MLKGPHGGICLELDLVSNVPLRVGVKWCDSILANEVQVELASVASRKAF